MKLRFISSLLLPAVLAVTAVSCVKEQRAHCPCYLTVFFDEAAESTGGAAAGVRLTVLGQEAFRYDRALSFNDYLKTGHDVAVTKGLATVCGYALGGNLSRTGDVLSVTAGEEPDSLFAWSDLVDCTGELASDTVRLHKQFATLHVTLRGTEEMTDVGIEAAAAFSAIDIPTLIPVKTDNVFISRLRHIEDDLYECRLPRQGDDSMTVSLYDRIGSEDRRLLVTIPVGERISETGYDWMKTDLDDIFVSIDYAKAEVQVSITDWEDGGSITYDF